MSLQELLQVLDKKAEKSDEILRIFAVVAGIHVHLVYEILVAGLAALRLVLVIPNQFIRRPLPFRPNVVLSFPRSPNPSRPSPAGLAWSVLIVLHRIASIAVSAVRTTRRTPPP